MSKDIGDGVAGLIVNLIQLFMLLFQKKEDARQAVEQDIAANEFNWDDPPRRRWWQ